MAVPQELEVCAYEPSHMRKKNTLLNHWKVGVIAVRESGGFDATILAPVV